MVKKRNKNAKKGLSFDFFTFCFPLSDHIDFCVFVILVKAIIHASPTLSEWSETSDY